MIKHTLYALSVAVLLGACGNTETKPKASTDLIQNPATADSSAGTAAASSSTGAVMTFEKTDHNFGTITQGEQAEYNFKFQNTGSQDLIIASASASCGCTIPEYSKEPIKPGGTGYIKVKFNSEHRLDGFEKAVTVTANTTPLETLLIIRGFISPKPGDPTNNTPMH
jgi:hypothetical protein